MILRRARACLDGGAMLGDPARRGYPSDRQEALEVACKEQFDDG